ncbi:hypothetical protein LCGC14_2057430 [marine sediment metagenome]|uniref:Uncharacterized protein n=1 Tax=marine sediment metagenome TaxID=412755 RepID=A0A0F9H0M6_9ZZZZ
MNKSKYKDKFTMSTQNAEIRNKELLDAALDALYSTYILSDISAAYRGKAIQNINSLARSLGYADLVRTG